MAMFLEIPELIKQVVHGHQETLKSLDSEFWRDVEVASSTMIKCFEKGGKLIAFGNGGSAADAQHLVTEFVVRLDKNDHRPAFNAISLTTNTSLLTAAGNDIGFENIFARQIEGLGKKGDLILAISTSGNSLNVIRAVETGNENGIESIGLLGGKGGKLKDLVKYPLVIPSENTQRIQEMHIFVGHILCEIVTTYFRAQQT